MDGCGQNLALQYLLRARSNVCNDCNATEPEKRSHCNHTCTALQRLSRIVSEKLISEKISLEVTFRLRPLGHCAGNTETSIICIQSLRCNYLNSLSYKIYFLETGPQKETETTASNILNRIFFRGKISAKNLHLMVI